MQGFMEFGIDFSVLGLGSWVLSFVGVRSQHWAQWLSFELDFWGLHRFLGPFVRFRF